MEEFAHGRSEFAETAFFRSEEIDGLFWSVRGFFEETSVREWGDRSSGDSRLVLGNNILRFGSRGIFGWLDARDGNGGLFAGRAVVDLDPTLLEPEIDLFGTGLLV